MLRLNGNPENVGNLAGEENVEFGLFARGSSRAVIQALSQIGYPKYGRILSCSTTPSSARVFEFLQLEH